MEGDDDEGKKKRGFQGLGNFDSDSGSGSGSLRSDVKQQLEFHLDYVPLSSSGNVSSEVNEEEEEEEEEEERKGVIDIDASEEEGERLGNEGGECVNENRKYSAEEKGKGKLSMDGSWLSMSIEEKLIPEEGETAVEIMPEDGNDATVGSGTISDHEMAVNALMNLWNLAYEYDAEKRSIERVRMRARYRRDRNRRDRERIAEIAPTFARVQPVLENDVVGEPVIDQEVEDQPGPFFTAMRRIKQSEAKPDIEWNGMTDPERKRVTPKLEDLSINLLAKHVEALSSLRGVPDVLRNKLSNVLCDSRKMDSHAMELLTSGSPTEIRVKDCSWLTEEQFSKIMKGCDTNNLTILQLDLCGNCLPDYILRATLAKSPNSLPVLSSMSLKGACRLTDGGIKTLVASAPSLCSINLAACPLLSSISIQYMADALGSMLKELYLDDCQNIDMMLSLPALQKFEFLEVLSIADIETVSDDFVSKFVTVCGWNLKELNFSDCRKLTDKSLKAVGEHCSALQTLHLANLRKLTDSSLGYLANGCQLIQTLTLRDNSISDEGVAAFLEASGEPLTEISLNKVKKVVGNHTALSLARCCSKNLLSLDLSWCRGLNNSALGLIVDSCSNLRILKLFGCTQITSEFVTGHSNKCVQIVGLQLRPILEHLNIFGQQEAALRYSSVPVRKESQDIQG
ncbi:hypothetical protein C5167_019905 [Papaver somniferum]|uniref:F-box/LRR-repeat protein 15-like leucin rich repeat domain-containing protein n=1 Tax=Papaver somniferum TaxID=3469 RepID=A0A4Y7IS04_PAPSO|nr:uncharacterized protein LOC113349277 isoform X2 [Papaver somniferum]RZC51477.1 hypothetical protein C5167_019905 [Papaver somniferum]